MYLCLPIFNDEKEMICKNCGTEFEGNFCNHCGQKSTVERLTWKSVWDNILHGIFHVDNTFVKTTRTLVVHPDRLISDYFAGRRKGYMAPIPLLAVWCVILLFFGHIEGGAGTISTIEVSATHNWIVEHYTLLTIVTVPFMVLAVKIAFRKAGAARYNWVEYLLGCCYLSVLYILLSLVLMPIGWVLDASYYTVYGWTSMVLCLLPTYWAAYSFFPDKFWKTLGRTLWASVLYLLFSVIIAVGVMLIIGY